VNVFACAVQGGVRPACQGRLTSAAVRHGFPIEQFLNSGREHPMLVTTTPSIDGKRITRYCGVVAGEAILGANLFKDLFAGIRDLVGGRSATYERELQRARDIALKELQERAEEMGANAVVGVDLDYEVLGQGNGMLMVSASGTAVVVE
jgi:uncharacterized protein YbjQ (UPF0145 family)